ncbi:Dopey domain protein [Entamoeba marina]
MRRNIIEDVDLTFLKTTKDKSKYIKFNEEAEKQLNQMEKCKVWTDILQMVQSFTKFIKSHKSFPVVPAKQTFMRRMAQALDPQIPSGNERLSYDIWCFTPGLFPLIRTGATDIRIKCLQIVKTHLLSIIKTIPEMHRSLVVAVVVGMEENSSGIKDKTIEILDALKDGNEKYFWETCWDVLRVNPVSRKPLLVYLHLRLSIPFENNQTPTKEQLLYSVLNTLSDEKSLVLREMLDIVCTRMRLDSGIFTKTQMTSLLERMFLLLPKKKDSGLTRRVHFYLLGLSAKTQDTQQEEMLEYFTNYSSSIVETALINLFNYFNKTGVEKIIGISEELLGKQVIGEQVIGTIIKSVVLLLKDSQEDGNRENVSKIIEFLSKVDATILFDYNWNSFSFLNSYQGDEEQMKLFDTLCVNTSMKTCDYLKTVIEENGTIEQIEECLNLIDFCLKDGIVAQNEKDLEILKLTIEINNTFHCFIEKYIKNDTEIRDTKFAAFLQFCEIIQKNIEICDISKEEEKDQEEEEMGIESIEILMRKEVRLNGWINSLKDLITNHSQPIIRVKATKYERDSFDLNNIEFIKKMFNSLWDCLNPENYPILTDIVLFFHTLGAQHIQTTYDFITEKVKTRSEEQLCKYVLFWKHSTVLVYDVDTSPFNRALLFFLQHFIYENHDPFFHDFLSTSLNIQTIERIIPPLLTILLTPNEMRESHYFGFEINDSLIEKHLQILDTLVCCSNSKLIDSLESTSIPRSLLNLYKELNVQNYVQNLDAPTNLLSLIFHTLIFFSFQSLGVNVLLHLSTFYGEMSSIQQICVSMQYPILIVFAESISACPKLQLHLISLVKQIMKISDVTEPTQCITRYSLFLQTCISGLCQEKYVYRSLFFTFINDILPLIPISEYKSSVILLMQAVSNVVSQTCNLSSPHILVLSEEVNPIIDIQKHLFDYTLTLFPYKNPFPLNEQQTQHSASQQIGNAVLFIPLLVVSVFTDGKGSKEKQKIEPHFLTASLLFPHEFIGEYLLLFDVFPDEHATIFRSFRPETTLTILWALIVLSEANVYNDVSPKQINNFIQFFIEKVITPRELYTTQMYIQTLISYHSTNDEMIFSLIHTLKLFLVSISQIEQKYPMKLGNGWQELISSLISKYTTILQRWKLEGLQQRHEKGKVLFLK